VGAARYEPFVGLATWRQADPTLLVEESVTAVVQIDGKVRGTLTVPARISADELEALARADEKVVRSSPDARSRVVVRARRSSASPPRSLLPMRAAPAARPRMPRGR
jgi:leucyl-tRNA synthetase